MAKDKQITGMAGEFLAVGKLCKMELQVSLTLGNAKSIDLFVYNPNNNKKYSVQVKTSRKKNNFRDIKIENIKNVDVYIFVFLNNFGEKEDFFILKNSEIQKDMKYFFGSKFDIKNLPEKSTLNWKSLTETDKYKDKWDVFEK